jgi:hypothetical protein
MLNTKKFIGNDTEAFWSRAKGPGNWPGFLEPSGANYSRVPFSSMADRGIENRLLDSLAAAMPNGTIIAGGFMTAVMGNNKDAQDIDLFFTNPISFAIAFNRLTEPTADKLSSKDWDFERDEHWAIEGYKLDKASEACFDKQGNVKDTTRFVKFIHESRPPIQLIKLAWYDNAEHVIDSFDLTVAQFAYDVTTQDLVCNPVSIMDLMGKKIVLHRMQFPSSTMRRVIKYTKKGYYACPGALAKIAEQVAEHIGDDDAQFVYVD